MRSHVKSLILFILFYMCSESSCVFRSACRRDTLMKATDRDKKLERTAQDIISEIHAASLPLCVKKCTGEQNCRSVNYKKAFSSAAEKNCQTLGITKVDASVVLTNAAGWIHYEDVRQVGVIRSLFFRSFLLFISKYLFLIYK